MISATHDLPSQNSNMRNQNFLLLTAIFLTSTLGCCMPNNSDIVRNHSEIIVQPAENSSNIEHNSSPDKAAPKLLITKETKPTPKGIPFIENSCLDTRSNLLQAWFNARYLASPGAQFNFAIRHAETDADALDNAIHILEILRNTHTPNDDLGDIFAYHLARLYEFRANAKDGKPHTHISPQKNSPTTSNPETPNKELNSDPNDNPKISQNKNEDITHKKPNSDLQQAILLYTQASQYRRSPYYHLARAKALELKIATNQASSSEIGNFIETYPDYPKRNRLRFHWAERLFKESQEEFQEESQEEFQTSRASDDAAAHSLQAARPNRSAPPAPSPKETAIDAMQELAFWNPKMPEFTLAQSWLNAHEIPLKTRTYSQILKRIDDLRRIRFWNEAESAANDALQHYPNDAGLMYQSARIAYERSDHALGAARFDALLKRLDGETVDKIRPNTIRAYLARAYAYMGNCRRANELYAQNVAKLSKRVQLEAKRDFALACGDIESAYNSAKQIKIEKNAKSYYNFAFLAYINRDYEVSRRYLTMAIPNLSGTHKRRARYFLAQATLKAAQQAIPLDAHAQTPDSQIALRTQNSISISIPKYETSSKKQNKNDSKNKKNAKRAKTPADALPLPPPTLNDAKKQFQAIIDDNSDDYYAILAWSRLDELSDAPAEQTLVLHTGDDDHDKYKLRKNSEEYAFDEYKYLTEFNIIAEKFADTLPELQRVRFFHEAELYSERNALFRRLAIEIIGISRLSKRPTLKNLWTTRLSVDGHLVDNRRNPTGFWGHKLDLNVFDLPSQKQTAERQKILARQTTIYDNRDTLRSFVQNTLIAFHDYYLARRYTSSPKKTCGLAENIESCSIFYPHAFHDAVLKAARQNAVAPELIWTLMNIESAFNPDSISHADAYGLLQIIPMTGYKVAEALNISDFGPYDLIKPESSIAMGTWYFAQILHKFQGYATLSMAAYNGGPHQVARWLTAYAAHLEHDAFIELIPYDEARNYVKKGMARLLIFERTDRQNPDYFFKIPNTLPQNSEKDPNY